MRTLGSLGKGVLFYLLFSSLCAGVTLFAMDRIARRAGKPELFHVWREEMGDAFREAGDFLSASYARIESRCARRGGRQ